MDARECATPQGTATYHLLRQVLENHIRAHHMSLPDTFHVGIALLGDSCLGFCRLGTPVPVILQDTRGWLKRRLRDRQDHPVFPPIDWAPQEEDQGPARDDALLLWQAMGELLKDATAEHQLDLLENMNITLALMADLLSIFLHDLGQTVDEVDELLETHLGDTLTIYVTTAITPSSGHDPR